MDLVQAFNHVEGLIHSLQVICQLVEVLTVLVSEPGLHYILDFVGRHEAELQELPDVEGGLTRVGKEIKLIKC